MRRLRNLLSDSFWLYLFPAVAVVMPWRWYFAICQRIARRRHRHDPSARDRLDYARQVIPDLDETRFHVEQELTRLVDSADAFLALARGSRWFRKHVDVSGSWPAAGQPLLCLGSHWGAANWIWHSLRRHGHVTWMLANPPTAGDFGRGRLASWYGRLRDWGLRRIGSAGILFTGGARTAVEQTFNRHESMVGLIDVPAPERHPRVVTRLLGRSVWLPSGLLHLAQGRPVSVVWYRMGFDPDTGRRMLHIEPLGAGPELDIEATIHAYASRLDAILRAQPGQWQGWSLAPQLLQPVMAAAETTRAPSPEPLPAD